MPLSIDKPMFGLVSASTLAIGSGLGWVWFEWSGVMAGGVLIVAALLAGYGVLASGPALPQYGRPILRRAFVLLGVSLALFLATLSSAGALTTISPFVPAALLTAIVVGMGWFVTFFIREWEEAQRQSETRRRTMRALREEIFIVLEKLDYLDLNPETQEEQDKIRAGGEAKTKRYHPFPVSLSQTTVFDSLAEQTSLLEPPVLGPVVRFYTTYSDLAAFIEDFRSERFSSLPADRRVKGHQVLTQTRRATLFWAIVAYHAINEGLDPNLPKRDLPRSGKNPDIAP